MRRALLLAYGDALLFLMRRETARSVITGTPLDCAHVRDLCDRFERVQAALAVRPLVWNGDYA